MIIRTAFLASFPATLLATAAVAQVGGLMGADANGDGTVSRAEAEAVAIQRFDAQDTDKDGFLTSNELSGAGLRAAMVGDTDGDGKFSRAEFVAQRNEQFARIDSNGDGIIAADEYKEWATRVKAAMKPG